MPPNATETQETSSQLRAATARLSLSSSGLRKSVNRAQPPQLSREIIDACEKEPPPKDDEQFSHYRQPLSSADPTNKNSESMSRPGPAPLFSDSPNARSKTITTASGPYTNGALNQHPSSPSGYTIGVSEDTGNRRTMEDSHSFVADFAGVRGQGYFAVFDGHAGKHAAEWCGAHFHEKLIDCLGASDATGISHSNASPSQGKSSIPDVLNRTFHSVDDVLSRMAEEGQTHSGCTAVAAFLRLEDDNGNQPRSFVESAQKAQQAGNSGGISSPVGTGSLYSLGSKLGLSSKSGSRSSVDDAEREKDSRSGSPSASNSKGSGSKFRNVMRNITGRGTSSPPEDNSEAIASTHSTLLTDQTDGTPSPLPGSQQVSQETAPIFDGATRRVLYTANAGDARAVLSRGKGQGSDRKNIAVRLTYDHKGSDAMEARRIKEAGGFVMNNRVNGVLAVTRSLGDSSMKEFVVGSPYTTETELGPEDDMLIIACDGLWDVIDDQAAVDLAWPIAVQQGNPQGASRALVQHALEGFSNDNVSVMVVTFAPWTPSDWKQTPDQN